MPEFRSPSVSNRLATTLMAVLLLLRLYLPTSTGQTISTGLSLFRGAILLAILLFLLFRKRGVVSVFGVVNAFAINVILLICTLISPFTEFAYGGYVPILLFSVLFCVNLRDVGLTVGIRRIFDAANALNIVLAV